MLKICSHCGYASLSDGTIDSEGGVLEKDNSNDCGGMEKKVQ